MNVMKKSDVIRKMRPLQRIAAQKIIEDVTSGNAPASIDEAVERYVRYLEESFEFDDGNGWSGDIRAAAIWTLIGNGFSRGRVVNFKDGFLTDWSDNRAKLEAAAAIEIEFGGNRALSLRTEDIVSNTTFYGKEFKADRFNLMCSAICSPEPAAPVHVPPVTGSPQHPS